MPAVPERASVVQTEVVGSTLVMTLDRPQARNAVDLATAEQLAAAMIRLDESDELAVGVLTGAGGNFCAGMDLKAFAAGEVPVIAGRGFAGFVEQPPAKPIIAAVEGYALAGGLELVLACDLVVASREASFGIPEVRRGLIAGAGGLLRLPDRIPVNVAMEWALTGAHVPAERAYAAGLVNRLCDAGEALTVALELADTIAANAPLAVRASKQVIVQSRDWTADEAFARQAEVAKPVAGSADSIEGAVAFAEKRPPRWQGR
jgi:enoyl-CoA hydratase